MKPWLVWLLGPRPPWWRSTKLWLPLLLAAIAISVNVRDWTAGGTKMGEAARLYEIDSGILVAPTPENRASRVRIVVIMYRFEYTDAPGSLVGSIRYWIDFRGGPQPSWFTNLMSVEELASVVPHWEGPIRDGIRRSSIDVVHSPEQEDPDHPMRRMLRDLIAEGREATFEDTRPIPRFLFASTQVIRPVVFWIFLGTFVLAISRRWFEGMVIRRHKRLAADTCPSCEYPSPGAVCPECGIDVKHERILVQALYQRGYRGLQQLGQSG